MIRLALALLLAASSAQAYVRSTTDKGTAVFWPGSCTWVHADTEVATGLGANDLNLVLARSIDNWQAFTLGAGRSYLQIKQDPVAASETTLDRVNVVKVRKDKWCRTGTDGKEVCYSAHATAITTVFYISALDKPENGNIVDADIELNSVNFTLAVLPPAPVPRVGTTLADLENTLTHELGHFQGLDHTCWDHTTTTAPLDGEGQAIPDCNDVVAGHVPAAQAQKILQATMYNYAEKAETGKRTIEADDVDGIAAIYPAAKDPKKCARPGEQDDGGCSTAGTRARPTLLTLGLAGLLLLVAARRRR